MLATARRALAASAKADPESRLALLGSERKSWSLISRAAELGHDSAVCEVFDRLRQLHLDADDHSLRQSRLTAAENSFGASGAAAARAVPIEEVTHESESKRWFSVLSTLALRGHVVAAYCTGLAFKFGLGVPRSSERARILLGALALSGHRQAEVALYGLERPQLVDPQHAFGLFALAREVAPGAPDPEADSADYQRFLDDSERSAEATECGDRDSEECRTHLLDIPSTATAAVAAAAAESISSGSHA